MRSRIGEQRARQRLALKDRFLVFRRERKVGEVIAHQLIDCFRRRIAPKDFRSFAERNFDRLDFLEVGSRRRYLIVALGARQIFERLGEAQPAGFVIRDDQDQGFAWMFSVEFVGQPDGAVKLAIILDQGSDVGEMARAVGILRFDECEEAVRRPIL